MHHLAWASLPTPCGRLYLAGEGRNLACLTWADGVEAAGGFPAYLRDQCRRRGVGTVRLEEQPRALRQALAEIEAYLAGERRTFSLQPNPLWGTDFQRQVWSALRDIPYGTTWSYAELAQRIGRPRAVRAVGQANGMNPAPIVVPCHRVIGWSGRLVGYAGGLRRKAWLLTLEGVLPAASAAPPPAPGQANRPRPATASLNVP